jgi:hypothetical protein
VGFLVFICILVLVALVVTVLSSPLRAARERRDEDGPAAPGPHRLELAEEASRDDLRAAREAKYREIRDAELDFRTGKLSEEDYAAVDSELRAEALAILDALERLEGAESG